MKKIHCFAERKPLWYCAAAEIVMLVSLFLTGIIGDFITDGNRSITYYVIKEAVMMLIVTGMLFAGGLQKVLTNKGSGFWKGLLTGVFLIIVSVISLSATTFVYGKTKEVAPVSQIILYIILVTLIGITEETLSRGIIATLMLRKFGKSRDGIWKAAILSGVFFGLLHLINLTKCPAGAVGIQMIYAAFLGMLLAAIYYRTGNIRVTVFLHAFIDFAGMAGQGIWGNGSVVDAISETSPASLGIIVPVILVMLFLFRSKKLPLVNENMGNLVSSEPGEE